MALQGQAYRQSFDVIKVGLPNQDTIEYIAEKKARCEFNLPVFGDANSDDVYRNDKSAEYWGYSDIITAVTFKLLRCGEEVALLDDNTYGEYFPYGFHSDDVRKYAGFLIDWKKVLIDPDLGEGEYQIQIESTILGGGTFTELSPLYCLKQFTVPRADGTVRIEYYNNHIVGEEKDDTLRRSYKGLNWYNSLRLPSAFFGFNRSEFEEEEMQYPSGNKVNVFDEQDFLFDLEVRAVPNFIHRWVSIDILMSDDIYITDYNTNNPTKPILRKNVKRAGNYEPEWQGIVKVAPVTVKFRQKVNNHKKRYC